MTPMVSTTSGLSASGEGLFSTPAFNGGSHVYYIAGTYTFTVPSGVTNISLVAVGGGGGGGAGFSGSTTGTAGGASTFSR